jgi:hypothetical protein
MRGGRIIFDRGQNSQLERTGIDSRASLAVESLSQVAI